MYFRNYIREKFGFSGQNVNFNTGVEVPDGGYACMAKIRSTAEGNLVI
jgi:hypothetical protein